MANPQIENGYTRIANEVMEALARIRINGECRQVIDVILRKTYGFNKKEDRISLSQFVLATGLKKSTVCKALNIAYKINIITHNGTPLGNIYRFNKDFESWRPLPKKVKPKIVTHNGNESLPIMVHTKDTNTKEILASQETLIEKTTITMKKNTFGRYREDASIDSHETIIDADTGLEETYKPKTKESKIMMDLIAWADNRKGGKTLLLGKQMKAIKMLKDANISPSEIKARWIELENTDFHKLNGMDFMSVVQSFDKKPL